MTTTGDYWTTTGRLSRRKMLRASGLAGAGLAGAALLGCGDSEDTTSTATAPPSGTTAPPAVTSTQAATPEGGPRAGGSLSLANSVLAEGFNVITNFGEANYGSGVHVYDRPISPRLGERVYVLEAAESVETPDELTVVFTLQEGLVYQDRAPVNGRAVHAEDIAILHEYTRDNPDAREASFQRTSMESVEAADERTVVFHLQRPNAYLFSGSMLGFIANNCIVPRELTTGDFLMTEPVGSGPYQLKDVHLGVSATYERNPTFRRAGEGLPYIDERTWLGINDPTALEAAFRAEQHHAWDNAAPETVDRILGDIGDRLTVVEYLSLRPYMWNVSNQREWFGDVRVREAIYRAFDPDEFIDIVAGGWARRLTSQIPGGLEEYQLEASESEEYLRHDPEAARQLLDAAGFDLNREYHTITTGLGGANETGIQVFAEQLRRIGITNNRVQALPHPEWGALANVGDYDFEVVTHAGFDTPHQTLRLHHTNTQRPAMATGLLDPEIDAMIEESEMTVDRAENIDLVKQIQLELFRRYSPTALVFTDLSRHIRWGYIQDWEFTPAAFPMYRVEAWLDT